MSVRHSKPVSYTHLFGSKENFAKFIRKPSLYKIGNDWMTLLKYSITDGLLQTTIAMRCV